MSPTSWASAAKRFVTDGPPTSTAASTPSPTNAADAPSARVAAHRLGVFYWPRHATERNPDESLNNDLKGQVNAQGLPHDKAEERSRIQQFMRRLPHLPQRVMSSFLHPAVQYAANINV